MRTPVSILHFWKFLIYEHLCLEINDKHGHYLKYTIKLKCRPSDKNNKILHGAERIQFLDIMLFTSYALLSQCVISLFSRRYKKARTKFSSQIPQTRIIRKYYTSFVQSSFLKRRSHLSRTHTTMLKLQIVHRFIQFRL